MKEITPKTDKQQFGNYIITFANSEVEYNKTGATYKQIIRASSKQAAEKSFYKEHPSGYIVKINIELPND